MREQNQAVIVDDQGLGDPARLNRLTFVDGNTATGKVSCSAAA